MLLALLLTLPFVAACGSSDDEGPVGPRGGDGNQSVSGTATPPAATVTRGGAGASTTIVFTATGGVQIGSSLTINRQFGGIAVNQASSQTVGSTVTRVFSISADATVPPGVHQVSFSSPVSGFTGGSFPTNVVATFSLTVSP